MDIYAQKLKALAQVEGALQIPGRFPKASGGHYVKLAPVQRVEEQPNGNWIAWGVLDDKPVASEGTAQALLELLQKQWPEADLSPTAPASPVSIQSE